MAVLLVGNVIAGAISIKIALKDTKDMITRNMPIKVTIQEDYGNYENNEKLTEEIIKKMGESVYSKKYDYVYSYYLDSSKLESSMDDPIVALAEDYIFYNTFTIEGTSREKLSILDKDTIKLIDGDNFSTEDIKEGNNVIIISKELASKNNLSVGDTISLCKPIEGYDSGLTETYSIVTEEYKIVGIFEVEKEYERDTEGNVIEKENELADTIYMPNNTIVNIYNKIVSEREKYNVEDEFDSFYLNATYYITSIDDVDNFKNDNLSILPKGYLFSDNTELYNQTIKPMQNIGSLANIIEYASIFASVIIIGLISIIFCKERKKEMGIYLALGERKINIAIQILLETLIVAFGAITISIFTGNLLAKNISETMLENEITSTSEDTSYYTYDNDEELSDEEILDSYTVKLGFKTIIFIYFISLSSIFVSTLLPIEYTLNLKPREILM